MKLISLDIETYGKCRVDAQGRALPEQTVYHPLKSLSIDGVPDRSLILSCAITLPETQPDDHTLSSVAALVPGRSMFLRMDRPEDRLTLRLWLQWCDAIMGMNLPFDLLYLSHWDPTYRAALRPFSKTLIDVSVLSFLDHESRPERSLKSLGPVLNRYVYDEEDAKGSTRYDSPSDPRLASYNAQDTHNALLACAALAHSIRRHHGDHKERCLPFWSASLWCALDLARNGHAYSIPALTRLEGRSLAIAETASRRASSLGLQLTGPGSEKSKDAFIEAAIPLLSPLGPEDSFALTPKKKKVSWKDENRELMQAHLPHSHPYRIALGYADVQASAQKLVSTYTFPLLRHSRKDPAKRRARLFRLSAPPDIGLAHASWFVTPSAVKDSDTEGGTIQSRWAAKDPPLQTDPPPLKDCYASRYADGICASMDLSQIELRVAALLSGEPALLHAYQQGWDLHGRRALDIWGPLHFAGKYNLLEDTVDSWKKHPGFDSTERQVGKGVNFADLFRSSAATMQRQVRKKSRVHFPLEVFQQIEKSRPRTRPVLWEWQESLIKTVKREGVLRLPWTGHSRSFYGDINLHKNEICNFPVQTTASVVMHHIHHALLTLLPPDILITNQVHDALYFDLRNHRLPLLKDALVEALARVTSPTGYWGRLCAHHGRTLPLSYDLKAK